VPFTDEAINRLNLWFNEYNLRCCCVPYTDRFIETTERLREVPNGKWTFLYPDHLGETTAEFLGGTYEQLNSIGILEPYTEVDLVLPVSAIKTWNLEELENITRDMTFNDKPVKAIIQTAMMYGFEIKMAADICIKNDVPFLKTGTGYFGITLPKHVSWLRDSIDVGNKLYGNETFLKVAGGVRSFDLLNTAVDLGADLIGTSHTASIIEEIKAHV